MKKMGFFFIATALILSFFYIFKKNKETSKQAHEPINQEKLIEPSSPSMIAPATQEPHYQREQLKRPLFKRDLTAFSNMTLNDEKLLITLKEIKARQESGTSDYNFPKETGWNLAQLPSNQEEYELYFDEIQIKALNKIVEHAMSENVREARIAHGGYVAAQIMKALEFRGYGDDEQFILRIPTDRVAALQNRRQKEYAQLKNKLKKKRRPANAKKEKKIDESFSYAALFKERIEQSIYYADFKNPDEISDRYWTGKKTLFENLTGTIDYLVTTLSNAEIFYTPPKKTHASNMALINDTLDDAHKRPDRYGLVGEGPFDVASLEFETISEPTIRQVSIHHALLGAGLSTLMGRNFINQVGKARIFSANLLITIGVESLISALGCYWGNVRLIFLHRYHTYIRRSKEYHKHAEKDFIISKISPFNPDRVFLSEATRIQLNKSWLWGFSYGTLLNRVAVHNLLGASGTKIAMWAIDGMYSKKAMVRVLSKGTWWVTNFMTLNIAESISRVLMFPFKVFSWAGTFVDFVKSALTVTPGAIAAYLVDFGITTIVIYSTIHSKLYASTVMLSRLYYGPEMSIYLSHLDSWHKKETFKDASRRLFYPLCHFFATTDLNSQKMTRFDQSKNSSINLMFKQQAANCLTVISAYEDVEYDSIASHFKKLLENGKIDKEVYNAYLAEGHISKQRIADTIVKIHEFYPEFYRINWISALKSIYTIDTLPNGFFGFKNLMIYGKGLENNENFYSYASTSTHKRSEEENVLQFEWTIEKMAHRARDLKIEAKLGTKGDSLNLAEAYSIFWRHHSKKQKSISREVLNLLDEKEVGYFRLLWQGLVAAKNNLQWLFKRLSSDPYELTFRYEIEQNLEKVKAQ